MLSVNHLMYFSVVPHMGLRTRKSEENIKYNGAIIFLDRQSWKWFDKMEKR